MYYQKVEEYFKTKINWKIYNLLLDRATEYEDTGDLDICVEVMYRTDIYDEDKSSTEYHWIYKWYRNEDNYVNTNMNFLKKNYKEYGLFYSIIIYHEDDKVTKPIIDDLCSKLKNKLKFVDVDSCSFVAVPIEV